jgi:hypothetical protein
MVAMIEAGRRFGRRAGARDPGSTGFGVVEGALFALLGLLVAFTFSGAASRFDDRRHAVVEEANAVGTAYLRLDLVPLPRRTALQQSFRDYVDARLEAYRALPDEGAARAALARATSLEAKIWSEALAGCQEASGPQAATLLLPALNEAFDIANTRTALTQLHPPRAIPALLGVVALICSLLAGHAMAAAAARSWLHVLGFAALLGLTVYVILDLEYPRLGILRVSGFDQVLVDARARMR